MEGTLSGIVPRRRRRRVKNKKFFLSLPFKTRTQECLVGEDLNKNKEQSPDSLVANGALI